MLRIFVRFSRDLPPLVAFASEGSADLHGYGSTSEFEVVESTVFC
jgi:hypothetical protein